MSFDVKKILKKLKLPEELASKLTRSNAMLAKCHSCCAEYYDGKDDCGMVGCELYPWMPYRKQEPFLNWLRYNPKKKGKVTWEDSKRDLTDEQRAAMGERLKKSRMKDGGT